MTAKEIGYFPVGYPSFYQFALLLICVQASWGFFSVAYCRSLFSLPNPAIKVTLAKVVFLSLNQATSHAA